MAVNDEIVDRATQHQIRLVRLANGSVRRLNLAIARAQREIVQLIATLSADPTARPEQIVAAIRQALNRQTPILRAAIDEELRGLPPYEAQATIRLIDGALPQNVALDFEAPSAAQLEAVLTEPLAGKTIDEWFQNLTDTAFDRFRSAVRIGFLEGQTTPEIVSNVRDTFEIQRANAEAVARTLLMTLAQRSRQLVFEQNADLFVGLTWRSTLDPRTCPICQERDGQVFPVEKGPRPPAHVNCLPGDTLVLAGSGIAAVSKRRFDGEVVVIKTTAGRELACTPNHPILTRRGWIAARSLHVGSDVSCNRWREHPPSSLVKGDGEHMPARIHQVAETFFARRKMIAIPVPTTAEDFHGDGMAGEIAVIGANRKLRSRYNAALCKHDLKGAFAFRSSPFGGLQTDSSFAEIIETFLAATSSIMRGLAETLTFLGCCPSHSRELLLAAVANMQFSFSQQGFNAEARGSITQSDTEYPNAGSIVSDQIVEVQRRAFHGDVFNLETKAGFYVANGVFTHNCRCVMAAALKNADALGLPPSTRASMNGQVPDTTTYGEWLANQKVGIQDEVLGKTRGQLFRAGKLPFDHFFNDQSRYFTLAELHQRESAAFKRAGLD